MYCYFQIQEIGPIYKGMMMTGLFITLFAIEQPISNEFLWYAVAITIMVLITYLFYEGYKSKRRIANYLSEINENREELTFLQSSLTKAETEIISCKKRMSMQEKVYTQNKLMDDLELLVEKSQMWSKIKKKMQGINIRNLNSADQEAIKYIERELTIGHENAAEWDKFLIQFDRLYPSFYSQIRKKNNGLSFSDKRFLAYLKLDLSSREIAEILGVSHTTISKSKARLRKKLHLSNEEDLGSYLSKI